MMLWLQTNKESSGTMNLGGSITRQAEAEHPISSSDSTSHIFNIGKMVEDMENKIRNSLNEVYFGKTNSILNGLRSINSLDDVKAQEAIKNELVQALQKRQGNNN